ncbi:hypothetical protein AB1Y20_007073 [Prymnesium parvum]|uniref:Procollagen-proline 4-dioxygenase n=1 Tax=Prymnesium parvum TaxID=97485 RepID=A0AB34J3I3_PRYPA
MPPPRRLLLLFTLPSLDLARPPPPSRTLQFGRLAALLAARANASGCADTRDECAAWAADGECAANEGFMALHCARSCGACDGARPTAAPAAVWVQPKPACADSPAAECGVRAARGECHASVNGTAMLCPVSCHLCRFHELLREALGCEDSHANCARWAASGECAANPRYMESACAAACQMCEKKRSVCDRPPNTPPAVVAGTIEQTMRRILRDFPQYGPKALSEPSDADPKAPWVVTLQNFINDSEAAAFVTTCTSHFERSLAGDSLSPVRTSDQCWCSGNECDGHPLTNSVAERISDLVRTPIRYMEPFQVIRYDVGQFYRRHHDQNSGHFTPQGPRVYTFFMYLNTPERGGGTRFNDLGITVPAVKGSAVLWPSVANHDPNQDEPKTNHEALPVEAGMKFASNVWVHKYDYRTPADKNCLLTHKNTH